jgi:flagellin-like hook-associated protein FlgL
LPWRRRITSFGFGQLTVSLKAQRQLGKINSELGNVLERLSSGQRINRASDDAAGLSLASSLQSDSRVFSQGIRNLNDGISLLSIASSAISSLTDITLRIQELAEQAANGSLGYDQRLALDTEAQALSSEFSRIAQTTKYNRTGLLDGSISSGLRLQAGYGQTGSITSTLGGEIGTGTFSTLDTAMDDHQFLQSADLNSDGYLDIVYEQYGQIYSQLATGSGTYGAATAIPAGGTGRYSDIALGDIDNDGVLDIVAGTYGDAVVVYGVGNGTFGAESSITLHSGAFATNVQIELGDVNGDGNLDIVGNADVGGQKTIVALGAGNGTFGSRVTYSYTGTQSDIKLADVNNDGNLDLLAFGDAGGGIVGFSVALGTGSGSFGAISSFTLSGASSASAGSISVGDINRDGFLDVLATTTGGAGAAKTYLNNGHGSFDTGVDLTGALSSVGLLADLDGDGNIDAVTTDTVGSLTIHLGNGNGTFQTVRNITGTPIPRGSLIAGDVDRDGVLELITGGSGFETFQQTTVSGTAGINPFSLKTSADALQAVSIISRKGELLSIQQGSIGAFQSRLDSATRHLFSLRENSTTAAARITDADIATDVANMVRLQILEQSATSVLAQINQNSSIVLSLLSEAQGPSQASG